jgi:hypothetical protein
LVETKKKHRIMIDLERLNSLNAEGCLACGQKFNLGDQAVLARGNWQGFKFIHEHEAVWDGRTQAHYERRHYAAMRKASAHEG